MPPSEKKDVSVLIPGMLPYMGKKDFAGVIKVRILRWGDYLGWI